MKTKELRDLTMEEINQRIQAETASYVRMRMNHRVNPLDKPSSLTEQRKLIARLKTVCHEMQSQNNNE